MTDSPDSLRDEQRAHWQRGERVPVESILARQPLQLDTEAVFGLVTNEIQLRRQAGETPLLDEYLQRFPDLAESLRGLFEGDSAIPLETIVEVPPLPDIPTVIRSASGDPAPPRVPGYEILGELGRGGMGVVYKARHVRLDRTVALKMIRSGELAGAEERTRFLAEAEAIAAVKHPGIVQVYDFGTHQGLPYFTLEFCAGGSLAGQLARGPMSPGESARLAEQLARAVQHAHEAGIVHRDLKPANVLLQEEEGFSQRRKERKERQEGKEGEENKTPTSSDAPSSCLPLRPLRLCEKPSSLTPKITDFGLAKRLDRQGLTITGAVLGSPSYMAPEQAQGKKVGPGADVYSLGAILFHCLTGRPPFKADNVTDVLLRVVSEEPVPPRQLNPATPAELEAICLKCLRKDPAQRYAGASDLADDLERFLQGEPTQARPVREPPRAWRWGRRKGAWVSALALLLIGLAVGMASLWPSGARHSATAPSPEPELSWRLVEPLPNRLTGQLAEDLRPVRDFVLGRKAPVGDDTLEEVAAARKKADYELPDVHYFTYVLDPPVKLESPRRLQWTKGLRLLVAVYFLPLDGGNEGRFERVISSPGESGEVIAPALGGAERRVAAFVFPLDEDAYTHLRKDGFTATLAQGK